MVHAQTQTGLQKTTRPASSDDYDAAPLIADLRRSVGGEVRFDKGSRALYATDASNYRHVPIGVVVPRTTDDVVNTVAACRRHGAPIVSRGGGTSLAGQCCNVAVVMDFSKFMNKIVDIDPERRVARVQPGVIHDQLSCITEPEHHLTFGPDPSTHGWCTFGGMIGNNSCGVHSVYAGKAVDNVHSMDILTYDGVRMRVGPTSEDELESIVREGGRRGEIYQGLRDLRDEYADLIRERYPDIPRRVSGYNLDDLLPEKGFNVARALVGTEGTCVTMLNADVRLIESPPVRALVVLGYDDIYSAGDHVMEIMEFGPVGLEGLDRRLVGYMKNKNMHPKDFELLPEGDGWLLVEFGGDTEEEAENKARAMMAALEKKNQAPDMKLYNDPPLEARIWEIRESGLGATAFVPNEDDTWTGWEDAAVDPRQLGDYLRDFRKLLQKYDYDASLYGHFGQACVHCRINFDLVTRRGIDQWRGFLEEAADLVVAYNGSLSAEHGDGQARGELLPKMYGEELVEAFRRFKAIWDPDWRMNPGKVVDPYPLDTNLRLGTDYNPPDLDTHFQFPHDEHSIARASVRCVGVGKCRRTSDAFMCPSFLATREEKDTTRGRAHMLFEMFTGRFIKDGWKSDEVKESLDLCLACKGCKHECPVDVDIATYKAEFLSHYFKGRLRPRDFYAMGLIGTWAKLGSIAPSLSNFFASKPPFNSMAKAVAGISQHREVPAFGSETFMQWYRRRGASQVDGPSVLLFPDVFNNHFFPHVLIAATRVLERLGYRVEIPAKRPAGIRPLIHYGMLKTAKKELEKTIEDLRDYAERGVPVIALEPSTVSVFRDDLPSFFPQHQDALRLADEFFLLSEFLYKEDVELPRVGGRVLFHAHCHQKAVLDTEAARSLLGKLGMEIEEPEPGCCGMAGSFGFEAKHYDIAVTIGEMNLLPAVRNASADTHIVIEGFSCHEQIRHDSDRRPLHLSELLLKALEGELGLAPPPSAHQNSRAPAAAILKGVHDP